MANVTVGSAFGFQPNDLFHELLSGNLLSATPVMVSIATAFGIVNIEGSDIVLDGALDNAFVSGTITSISLTEGEATPVAITGLSVPANEFGSLLPFNVTDDEAREMVEGVMRFLMSGDDIIQGGDNPYSTDVLFAGLGDDSVTAGAGDDIIMVGPGADTIDGGDGLNDMLHFDYHESYPATSAGVNVDLGAGTATNSYGDALQISNVEDVQGSAFNDTIVGSSADNMLIGGDGDDSLVGGEGTDYLLGNLGDDTMDGGAGNDHLFIEHGGHDLLIGGEGFDTVNLLGELSGFTFHFGYDGNLVFTNKDTGHTSILDGVEAVYDGVTTHSVDDFRPVVIAGQSVNEDSAWSFQLPEGSYRAGTTFTVTDLSDRQLPSWLTFDAATRTFTGTPPANFNGSVGIKVAANDNGIPKTSTFFLNVASVNDNPSGLTLSGNRVQENSATDKVVGQFGASDVDGDGLSYSLIDDAGGRFKIVGDKLVVADGAKLDYEQAKAHSVSVKVADASGGHSIQTFTISVADVAKEDVKGGTGADVVKGGSGSDKIAGGLGKDVLTGGKGKDAFVFYTKASKDNVDKVTDFNVKDDSFWLDNKVFTKLGKKGTEFKPAKLKDDFFTIGSKAKDKNDYLVYDNKKGKLFYDADGSGKGKAVEVASLSKNLKMTANDFFVI